MKLVSKFAFVVVGLLAFVISGKTPAEKTIGAKMNVQSKTFGETAVGSQDTF